MIQIKKVMHKVLMIATVISLVTSMSTVVFAGEKKEEATTGVEYSVEISNDEALNGATLLNEQTIRENGRVTVVKTYQLADGTQMIDTIEHGDKAITRSPNGSDTVTRKRVLGNNLGTISMTASFSWRTEGKFSYVKCKSMSAKKIDVPSNITVKTWDTSYTKNEVSVGKANATLDYYLHDYTGIYNSGTLKITCSDSGTISDNF